MTELVYAALIVLVPIALGTMLSRLTSRRCGACRDMSQELRRRRRAEKRAQKRLQRHLPRVSVRRFW